MIRLKRIFEKFLSNEIIIDFKACTYFFCTVFFYSVVQIINQIYSVQILTLVEMVITNYVICYIQVYCFRNFDESNKFGKNEIFGISVCTLIYAFVSYIFNWFDRNFLITLIFAAFVVICYICVILCYKVKRYIDTKNLNRMLENYKRNERSN